MLTHKEKDMKEILVLKDSAIGKSRALIKEKQELLKKIAHVNSQLLSVSGEIGAYDKILGSDKQESEGVDE